MDDLVEKMRQDIVVLLEKHEFLTIPQMRELAETGNCTTTLGRRFDSALRSLCKRRIVETHKKVTHIRTLKGPDQVRKGPIWAYRLVVSTGEKAHV